MKYFLILLLPASLLSQNVLQGGRFYVHHPKGLGVYILPDSNSELSFTLPYGARVELTKELSPPKGEQENIAGFWREVNTKKYHGYVLDSYLSRYPVPSTNCEKLQAYMDEVYRKQKVLYKDEKELKAITIIYQGGNEYVFTKTTDRKIHKVFLKNAKLKDGFFIGRACSHPAFFGIEYKPIQNKLEFMVEGLKNQTRYQLEIHELTEGTLIIYTEIQANKSEGQ